MTGGTIFTLWTGKFKERKEDIINTSGEWLAQRAEGTAIKYEKTTR